MKAWQEAMGTHWGPSQRRHFPFLVDFAPPPPLPPSPFGLIKSEGGGLNAAVSRNQLTGPMEDEFFVICLSFDVNYQFGVFFDGTHFGVAFTRDKERTPSILGSKETPIFSIYFQPTSKQVAMSVFARGHMPTQTRTQLTRVPKLVLPYWQLSETWEHGNLLLISMLPCDHRGSVSSV